MSEADVIERTDRPLTVDSLVEALQAVGLRSGQVVLVHASLSAIGWVAGGAQAVSEALQRAVGPSGTLVMPTHTGQYTNPAIWENPPVPDNWVETIRDERPAYRPAVSPTRGMGAIVECFRSEPGTRRSGHPTVSFAAKGPKRDDIIRDHRLDFGLGEGSPLARIYELEGSVLLLGVGHQVNTSLHLSEHRASIDLGTRSNRAPIVRDGERVEVEYERLKRSTDDFADIGEAFEERHGASVGTVGVAEARLYDQPELVDFGVEYMESHR